MAALASEAELLILDEPTSGLDPLMKAVFTDVIAEAKNRGTSVLLSSHILAEVETLADKLSIIRGGTIVESGTLAQLRGHVRTAIQATLKTIPEAGSLTGLHDVKLEENKLSATVDSAQIGAALNPLTGFGLEAITVAPPSLESLFLRLYENDAEVAGKKMKTSLAGTKLLLKTTLRHDFRSFAPWIAIATTLSASSVLLYPWIFPDAATLHNLEPDPWSLADDATRPEVANHWTKYGRGAERSHSHTRSSTWHSTDQLALRTRTTKRRHCGT